jgi:D-amino peptidase
MHAAVVKTAVNRFAADSMHPAAACELIRTKAEAAVRELSAATLPQVNLPATLTVRFRNADLAEMATWVEGVDRLERIAVSMTDDDPIRLSRTFIHSVLLTREIAE